MSRRGFTLIELLVVIAIIAILAAILFPVFATAREKARQTTCLSNEKQLGLGITQYLQDFDERIPSGTWVWGGGCGWAGQVYPYIKSTGAFTCPNDVQAANPTVSYAINSNLSYGANGTANSDVGMQVSQMNAPSKTVLLCEIANNTLASGTYVTGWGHNYTLPNDPLSWNIPSSPGASGTGSCADPTGDNSANCNDGVPTSTPTTMKYATGYFRGFAAGVTNNGYDTNSFTGPLGRHNGGSCYVFADCHVKWLPGNNVSGGASTTASWAPSCGGYNAGPGAFFAALTTCTDNTIAATFNYL
ncbi:MAG: DUF1559 domain-containing protein [Capsulimonadaceae bacterium]|nr:DUF1559 domain-containing protein [Capsulimonadaceae bacterium]